MISDVLADACAEIERYLRDMPDIYADCLDEVLAVYRAMSVLRQRLDCPLSDAEMVEEGYVPIPEPEEPQP
jgi:hypothetical protein